MDSEIRAITLKCSNCGSNLQISNDMTQFACGYCGSSLVVERKGGTVALKRVVDALEKVQIGTDKTAAELTYARLSADLASVQAKASNVTALHEKEISGLSRTKTMGCFVTVVVIAFWLLFGVAYSALSGDSASGMGGSLVFVALSGVIGGLIVKGFHTNLKLARASKEKALEPFLKEIAETQAKIARQKEIVD